MDESFYYPTSCLTQPIRKIIDFLNDDEPLLLVYGESGTGKSALLSNLQLLDASPAHLLVLKGRDTLTPEKLIKSISLAWHCDLPEEKQSQTSQFSLLLEQIAAFPEPALLVIDGGDKLPLATLAALVHMCLAQQKGHYCCRILLFGRPHLLKNFSSLHHPDIHFDTLQLHPLSHQQTEQFLRETLKQIKIPLDYLTPDVVNTIFEQSQGLPKAIARMAEEVFQSYQHPLLNDAMIKKKDNRMTGMHQQNNHDFINGQQPTEPLAHPLEQVNAVPPTHSSSKGLKNHWIKIVCVLLLIALFFLLNQYEHRMAQHNSAMMTPAIKPMPYPTDITPPQAITPKTQAPTQSAPVSPAASQSVASNHQPQTQATSHQATMIKITPVQDKQAKPATATPVTAPQGPYHWQVMASTNAATIQSALKQQHFAMLQAYALKKSVHGKQWYTLNIGHYTNQNAAKKALSSMPAYIQAHKPWLIKSDTH